MAPTCLRTDLLGLVRRGRGDMQGALVAAEGEVTLLGMPT
jgi:hypothetical protein